MWTSIVSVPDHRLGSTLRHAEYSFYAAILRTKIAIIYTASITEYRDKIIQLEMRSI